jgi:hypothetical protein
MRFCHAMGSGQHFRHRVRDKREFHSRCVRRSTPTEIHGSGCTAQPTRRWHHRCARIASWGNSLAHPGSAR